MAEALTPASRKSGGWAPLLAALIAGGLALVAVKSVGSGRLAKSANETVPKEIAQYGQAEGFAPQPAAVPVAPAPAQLPPAPPQLPPAPAQLPPALRAAQPFPPQTALPQVPAPTACCPAPWESAVPGPAPSPRPPDLPGERITPATGYVAGEQLAAVAARNSAGVPATQAATLSLADFVGLTIADVVQDPSAQASGVVTLGAVVTKVTPGGVGEKAGLATGDRIVVVGLTQVMSSFHFFYLLAQQPATEPARIAVVRQGRLLQLDWSTSTTRG